MSNQSGFVIKIGLLSGFLSILVKYAGRGLPIPPHSPVVLTMVLLPALVVGLLLWWRGKKQTTTI
jgi:uncharacterized membrane protein YagU involved in acid resistance